MLDPKTYADSEKKKNFFTRIRSSDQNRTSINKVTEFLPAFLFATAFKEAYIEKNGKKKHRGAYDLSLVKSEQLKYSRVFITDVLYMFKSKFTQIERQVLKFDFLPRSGHLKPG